MCNKPDIGDHHARSVCEQGLHRYVTHFQEGKEAQLRVNVDGDFGQTVFVRYPGYAKVRVLEGDEIVAVVDGRVTYTAVLGNKVTLPALTAKSTAPGTQATTIHCGAARKRFALSMPRQDGFTGL